MSKKKCFKIFNYTLVNISVIWTLQIKTNVINKEGKAPKESFMLYETCPDE